MAQTVSLIENSRTYILKVKSDGTDDLGSSGFILIIGIISFLVANFAGLIILAVILGLISKEDTLTINKQTQSVAIKKSITFSGSTVSQIEYSCDIDQIDFFTEETSGESTTITLRFSMSGHKDYILKFNLNLNRSDERNIYRNLTDLFQNANYRARQITNPNSPNISGQATRANGSVTPPANMTSGQRPKPDAYAPNISITDDELTYRRTLATAKDYWGMYWSFVWAVIFIVGGVSLAVFVIFPIIKANRTLYAVYLPLGLVALGLIFSGVHTILFKLIATKTNEIVHFNKMAQVVTLEDKFLTSKSTRKYLFEQVELKLEKQHIGDGSYLERTHVVTLVFDSSSPNPRKVELMKTRQEYQAIELYNAIAEVLYRPTLPLGTTGA